MKKVFTIILFATFLTSCATAPETSVDTSSLTSSTATASMESSMMPSSEISSIPSSLPSSAVLSDTAVSPQYLLNVNTTNDLAFLMGMNFNMAEKFWGKNSVKTEEYDTNHPVKYIVTLAPGVYVHANHQNYILSVNIDYTKTASRDAASLMGLNGYETIESIAKRFGKENVYPYNQNLEYGGEITNDISSEMCSVMLYAHTFYRANFDESGNITTAFIGNGI